MRYRTVNEGLNDTKRRHRTASVKKQEAFNFEYELINVLGEVTNETALMLETGVFYKTSIVDEILNTDCNILYFSVSLKEIEKKVGCQSEAWNNYMRIKDRENSICVDLGAMFKSDILDVDFLDYLGLVSRNIPQKKLVCISGDKDVYDRCVFRREELNKDHEVLSIQYKKSAEKICITYYSQEEKGFVYSSWF